MEEGAVMIISVGIGLELALPQESYSDCCYKVFGGKGTLICTLSFEICDGKNKFVCYLLVLCFFI